MKYLLLLAMLVVGWSSHAQLINTGKTDTGLRPEFEEKKTPEDRAKQFAEILRKEFKLHPDTARAIYRVTLQFERELESQIVNKKDMTAYEKAIAKKLKDEHLDQVSKKLTPEQWLKFQSDLKKPSEARKREKE